MTTPAHNAHTHVHPHATLHKGKHSYIPHPPPADRPEKETYKPFPDTGWRGEPELPSSNGGDGEQDFLGKPPYEWTSEGALFKPKYRAQCWCGNVAFEFHGDPVDAKHCHCRQCQHLHGAPFQWAVIFPKTAVRMVKNIDKSLHFFSTEKRIGEHYVPCKVSCDVCRSPIFDEGRNTVLAYPGSFVFEQGHIPLDFQPTAHIFYKERFEFQSHGSSRWDSEVVGS